MSSTVIIRLLKKMTRELNESKELKNDLKYEILKVWKDLAKEVLSVLVITESLVCLTQNDCKTLQITYCNLEIAPLYNKTLPVRDNKSTSKVFCKKNK